MKTQTGLILASIVLGGFVASGCRSHYATPQRTVAVVSAPREVIVTTEPPSIKREVIGVAPSANHTWIEGHWSYQEGRWVWNPGHWEARPRVDAAWVPGHWDRTSGGWIWRPGRWS